MNPSGPQMSPGAVLAGRWQVQDFIGSGETGEVYGVRDLHGTSTFALKLFWPNALAQAELWSAVQQTARTASGLGVEGVARAYDFGIDANSARPFLVAERVSWSSLADRVRLRGPLTPADVSSALSVLARALDAAHAVGLVHRDLKPENVFVSPDNANWVRVSDFGVALLRSASPPPPGWGGTVGWVAPDAADPNARSAPAMDVFAMGLVTFSALSGGALHRAARSTPIDPGALWQELTAPLDSASVRARELGASLDPAFDAWFQRAVAPTAALRFGSVGEMASAFDAIARTLVAPQSQNAVALPGVAAAIAQPLIFQPESRGSAGAAQLPAPTLQSAQHADSVPSSAIPGVKKRAAAPLLIGGAVLLFSLTGLGAYGLYQHRRNAGTEAAAEALASASAAASAALAAVPTAPAPPAVPPVAATPPPTAEASAAAAEPSSTTLAAPTPSAVAVAPPPVAAAPAKALVASKPASSTPAKPAASAKSTQAAAASAIAKAASAAKAATAAKPASATTPPRKKCGSVFIPCK